MNNFGVFILTHGRSDRVITYKTLRRCGYTGKIYLIIDNEDDQREEYEKKFENVMVFDKKDIAKRFDEGDNFKDRRAIFYARNASFEIAQQLGLEYYIQLDDDYTNFCYSFNTKSVYQERTLRCLDAVFESLLKFLKKTNAITVAIAQGGDFIGGAEGGFSKSITLKRKAMNSFICSTNKRLEFYGKINEDVNTYTLLNIKGELLFTINLVSLKQKRTQKQKGGMSELYLDEGTYIKSFYTIMYSPSCTKISLLGYKYKRIHHKINWDNCAVKILNEKHKLI